MQIGLVDVDSHNFPNIPLMKISAWHKAAGDVVEFAKPYKHYEKIYMSKIFTQSTEPEGMEADQIVRGGSGYDLENKLPDEIEHIYPDYSLYGDLTKDTAYGMLTRGCPRCNHTFCITPKKDGCRSRKVADLKEFWNGQKNICLLDQNILACRDHMDLLRQLAESGATVEFNGGMDARFITEEILDVLRGIKVKDFHFAWDDPREDLADKFRMIKESGIKRVQDIGVYVLTNYWSTTQEDLMRVCTLRDLGFMPYVMIFDKQKYVDEKGKWLKGVEEQYTTEQLRHFKTCQHMQRWANARALITSVPAFTGYDR